MVIEAAAPSRSRSHTEGFRAGSVGVTERPQLSEVRTTQFTLPAGEMVMGHILSDTKLTFTPLSYGWGFIGVDPQGKVHASDFLEVSTKIDPADVIHRPSITVGKGWTAIWFADENRDAVTIEQKQMGEKLLVLDEESIYASALLPEDAQKLINLGKRERAAYDVETLKPNVPYELPLKG